MNITSIIVATTRRIHAGAVTLHLQGLRAAVAGADLRVRRASGGMARAEAIANAAMQDFSASVKQYNTTKIARDTTRMAAITEAHQIGGAL